MTESPVPPGMSPRHEGAMTEASHAAVQMKNIWEEQDAREERGTLDEPGTWAELAAQLVPGSPDWPGGGPPDRSGEEPPAWLDENCCPGDPDEPGALCEDLDFITLAAEAEAEETQDRERRLRLLGNDAGTGYAHDRGDPPLPGTHAGPGRSFAQGMPHDTAAPNPALASAADQAAGEARDFAGVSDDALLGLLGARRRLAARQDWERLMTIAELIRRRPAAGRVLEGPARMPKVWLEGAAREIAAELAVTNREAVTLLGMAADLATRLPLTSAALRDGVLDLDKSRLIVSRLAGLTDREAGEAEGLFFATPGVADMTWGKVAYWILHAAMTVNPDAAVRHRKESAKDARVVLKQQGSGNYSLAGYELPAVAALAMDKSITARARELKQAGVPGSIQRLRMLAYLEAWNSEDPFTSTHGTGDDRDDDPQYPAEDPGNSGPETGKGGGCTCGHPGQGRTTAGPGLPGWLNLTAPIATMQQLVQRPGTLHGAGPVDPEQTRDLATAILRDDRSTICITTLDPDGRPAAHACGKPGPGDRTRTRRGPGRQGTLDDGRPPPGDTPALTQVSNGPPGTLGTWQLTTADRELSFTFENLTGPCDHAHQTPAHDPGKHLRHLTAVLNQECTFTTCRTPQRSCDYEHSTPHDKGGITCLCACGPVCRRNHLDKQQPHWKITPGPAPGWFTWTLPNGRSYHNGPTIYPS